MGSESSDGRCRDPLAHRSETPADGAALVRRAAPDSPCGPALARARAGVHRFGVIAVPAEERWVHTARRFAASLPARWDVVPEDQDSVLLIVGELAGNAARHGRAGMIVSLTFEGRAVRVEGAHSGATAPSPRPRCAGADDERGRGVGIVELLADWTETLEERHRRRGRAGVCVATRRPGRPGRALCSLEGRGQACPASLRAGRVSATRSGPRPGMCLAAWRAPYRKRKFVFENG
ncbi:ATP-binding protein [Streptomyces sp. NPDC050121]|uniref:ATP-binding protein n=1 Tax=Streptomyces sp. NPDC050121 TaxID=3365601 RepID=UPI00379137CB